MAGGWIGEADILVGADASRFEQGLQRSLGSVSKFVDSSLGQSLRNLGGVMESAGRKLTKSITLPAVGAAVAAAGITAALGWSRLKSLDTAQAQLRGLGYESADVGRITDQVARALQDGMMTLGEGAKVAAGALAAGVSEGAELERYIQLVDAAAVGMNRSTEETAGIFNRIQGSGKLMGEELGMIERSMPGFANAIAESLGVTTEEMYKMVSEGKVTSDQFLEVMEGFAGAMATEYAKSWEGMVQNTKAYIGILGENLLRGVFEKSKESIAEFIELLSSDAAQTWAAETGVVLGEVFSNIVDWVTDAIQWFIQLPAPIQAFAGALALAAVAAGPLLMGLGKLIAVGFQVASAVQVAQAAMLGWRTAAAGAALSSRVLTAMTQGQATAATLAAAAHRTLAAAKGLAAAAMSRLNMALLKSPWTWVIAAVVAVGAALAYFFTKTETGQKLWADFMAAMEPVVETLKGLGAAVAETAGELLSNLGPALSGIMDTLGEVFSGLGPIISDVFEAIMPLIQTYLSVMGEAFSTLAPMILPAIESIAQAFGGIMEALAPLAPMFAEAGAEIVAAFAPVIEQIVGELVPVFMELIATLLPQLMGIFTMLAPVIAQVVSAIAPLIASLVEALVPVITELVSAVLPVFVSLLSAIIPVIMSVVEAILPLVMTLVEALVPVITELVSTLLPVLMQVFMAIIPVILQVVAALLPLVTTIIDVLVPVIQALLDIVVAVFSALAPIISAALTIVIGVINTIIGVLTGDWSRAWDGIKQILQGVWDLIKSIVTGAINVVKTIITSMMGVILGFWTGVWNSIKSALESVWNAIKSAVQSAINSVRSVISSVLNAISSLWSSIWNRVKSTFSSIWNSIVSAARSFMSSVQSTFQSVLSFIGSIPSKVLGMFSGMGSLLVGAGRALINGFKNGIVNAFSSVRSAVSSGLSRIRNLFPSSPAKEGPFSGRGWVEYGGESVGETFADSIADSLRSGTADVSRALKPMSLEFNRPDFARTVMPLAEPRRAQRERFREQDQVVERTIQVNGPLVSIQGGLTVDSDDRVRQLSQELWNRANRTDRAQGRVNLGGVVRQ